MRKTSGILLTAATIGLGPFGAASASADSIVLIGPMAAVVGAGGFSIRIPAADEWQRQGVTEAVPVPDTSDLAPAYDVICMVPTQRTPYGRRDVTGCD